MSAIIDAGSSINLYMFHGGTNFGFINGAVHFHEYKSHVTSYGKYSPVLILPEHPSVFVSGLFMESPLGTTLAPLMHLTLECSGKVEVRSGLSLLNFQSNWSLESADMPVTLWKSVGGIEKGTTR